MDGPAQVLDAVLTQLLAHTGAHAARVVDGRDGTVVAQVGGVAGVGGVADVGGAVGDDVATLVQLARDAVPVAAREGGLDDLVVATRDAVHVLRCSDVPGAFLHVRLDHERGDVAGARLGLAAPVLQDAVRAVLASGGVTEQDDRSGVGSSGPSSIPLPREDVRPDLDPDRDPALAALGVSAPSVGYGALAVMALPPVVRRPRALPSESLPAGSASESLPAGSASEPLPSRSASVSRLPERSSAAHVRPVPALQQNWARDVETMRRVVIGLRSLS